jgi:cytochrome P450
MAGQHFDSGDWDFARIVSANRDEKHFSNREALGADRFAAIPNRGFMPQVGTLPYGTGRHQRTGSLLVTLEIGQSDQSAALPD